MKVYRSILEFRTYGPMKYYDITNNILDILLETSVRDGVVYIHAVGATPGLFIAHRKYLETVDSFIKKIIPVQAGWTHGNAYAHLRSTMIGTSLVIPVVDKKLWIDDEYSIFYLETRPVHNHRRKIIVYVKGV